MAAPLHNHGPLLSIFEEMNNLESHRVKRWKDVISEILRDGRSPFQIGPEIRPRRAMFRLFVEQRPQPVCIHVAEVLYHLPNQICVPGHNAFLQARSVFLRYSTIPA